MCCEHRNFVRKIVEHYLNIMIIRLLVMNGWIYSHNKFFETHKDVHKMAEQVTSYRMSYIIELYDVLLYFVPKISYK